MEISKKIIHEIFEESEPIRFEHRFFSSLGSRIVDEFSDIRLIGEIERPEGKETYEALRKSLKEFFEIRGARQFEPDFFFDREARAVLSLYLVWTGIFSYGVDKGNDIWPHVFEGLGFPHNPNMSPSCGKLFKQCLRENRLEEFPEIKSGLTYVTRILLHGLIPDRHMERFIREFILSELSYEKAVFETGQSIIRKWQQTGILQVQPKPLQNFIDYGHPINAEVVNRFWEMVKYWQEDESEFWQRWGLPKYMVDAFRSCVTQSQSQELEKKHPKKRFDRKPHLIFDLERNDFPVLSLPPQRIESGTKIEIEYAALRRNQALYLTDEQEISSHFRVRGELYSGQQEIEISPSTYWKIDLIGSFGQRLSSHEITLDFPLTNSKRKIPIFLFNPESYKALPITSAKTIPGEIIIIYPREAHIDFNGGTKLTEPMFLSREWSTWQYVICEVGKNAELEYRGPSSDFTNPIAETVSFSRDTENDLPVLRCDVETPSWIRSDGNFPIIRDTEKLHMFFSDDAQTLWRRAVGKLIRFDKPNHSISNTPFHLHFCKIDGGFIARIPGQNTISPGVYEIHLRGALGVEDVILPFVYLPLKKIERREGCNISGIVDSFLLGFGRAMDIKPLMNTIMKYTDEKGAEAIVGLKEDKGDAFCALKVFDKSNHPITVLLARSPIRWVRRSEDGLFLWRSWRADAEEISIQRLDEIEDTRVRIEIDTREREALTRSKINKKNNRLRIILKKWDGESSSGDTLMSYAAPNYRRSIRDVWAIDLKQFSIQLKSIRDAGHADIVLDVHDSDDEITLFRLLRYAEFKNFGVVSKGIENGKERLEVSWKSHPNEPRTRRMLFITPDGRPSEEFTKEIPDEQKPPFVIELDAPEKAEIWNAKIAIKSSRFGGLRSSEEDASVASKWFRMPDKWGDWIDASDLTHEDICSHFGELGQYIDETSKLTKMPWSSFLELFHLTTGSGVLRNLRVFLGPEVLRNALPFSRGSIWEIRIGSKPCLRLQIVSQMDLSYPSSICLEKNVPAKWYHIPEGVEIEFCVTHPHKTALGDSNKIWRYILPQGENEPVVISGSESFSFSEWVERVANRHDSGYMVPQIPILELWADPPILPILNGLSLRDAFSYHRIMLPQEVDNTNSFENNRKPILSQSTAMAQAFSRCLTDKRTTVFDKDISQLVDPAQIEEGKALFSRWNSWSREKGSNPLFRRMIRERLKHDPLNALSGATALFSRLKAHTYWGIANKSAQLPDKSTDLNSLLNDTQLFVKSFLPQSFLRDLILSELIISWYWRKKIFFKGRPRVFSSNDVAAIWRKRGFFRPGMERNICLKIDLRDNNDGTIRDPKTFLMWQKDGSHETLSWENAKHYVEELNKERFAGYSNWRLPTLEELGSLLEPSDSFDLRTRTAYYISPMFSRKQITCWSRDANNSGKLWYLDFCFGKPSQSIPKLKNHVRAVRSLSENQV